MFVFEPLADLFHVGGHGFDQDALPCGLHNERGVWYEPEFLPENLGDRDLSVFIYLHVNRISYMAQFSTRELQV